MEANLEKRGAFENKRIFSKRLSQSLGLLGRLRFLGKGRDRASKILWAGARLFFDTAIFVLKKHKDIGLIRKNHLTNRLGC